MTCPNCGQSTRDPHTGYDGPYCSTVCELEAAGYTQIATPCTCEQGCEACGRTRMRYEWVLATPGQMLMREAV